MITKAEADYKELCEKREIIKRDKEKIMCTIKELDERKNKTLLQTWEKVNTDFGSMFSTFLPGCTARLAPLEGKTVLDGLRPQVAFGGKWNPNPSIFLRFKATSREGAPRDTFARKVTLFTKYP